MSYQSVLLVGTSKFLRAFGVCVGLSIGQPNGRMELCVVESLSLCSDSHVLVERHVGFA